MWITKVSPSARAGSPVALCSMPDASMATWPSGSHSVPKMVAASNGMGRCTSKRSVMDASWQGLQLDDVPGARRRVTGERLEPVGPERLGTLADDDVDPAGHHRREPGPGLGVAFLHAVGPQSA